MKKNSWKSLAPKGFYNPYNFVRWSPPAKQETELARGPAPRLLELNGYTGVIVCRLKTLSPLFIKGNIVSKTNQNHETYEFFKSHGRHVIPGSSLRGMIRSVFEAVTNSTYTVLNEAKENEPLFYRGDSTMGARVVPARVFRNGDGQWMVKLMTGYVGKKDIRLGNRLSYAAWVLRYSKHWTPSNESPYHQRSIVKIPKGVSHGSKVYAILSEQPIRRKGFFFWNVLELAEAPNQLSDPSKAVEGYYYCSGLNINRKHDERFFFCADESMLKSKGGYPFGKNVFPLSEDVRQSYERLLQNYKEVNNGKESKGNLQKSRHIDEDPRLREGDLVYADLDEQQTAVRALYPVMISRRQYQTSVLDLLPEHVRPPQSLQDLCPATRLFGWVKNRKEGNEDVALKSRVYISDAVIQTLRGTFSTTFPVLGTPKPTAIPMYLRPASPEAPIEKVRDFKRGYDEGPKKATIRGRKMYLAHHDKPKWKEQEGTHLNISAVDVVEAGSEFVFEIRFRDLTAVELGALLWTLQLEQRMVHRLGYAKPLGYGHVKIEIDRLCIEDLKAKYMNWSFDSNEQSTAHGETDRRTDVARFIERFKQEMERAFDKPFDNIVQVADLKAILTPKPKRSPIHYPSNGSGEDGYKWFSNNKKVPKDRKSERDRTYREVLPLATEDRPLPYND
ncbi:TIGR03986 family CRISPR-associated RAMP protein [Geobacillus sp. C56-T2]|uniref:TIGR03986 family type III CRISPR-associated RAMP protein n=1 Tax=Geobacillus sp. C56-T2 TaxID=600773 RepID=UPI0011AA17A8|nr:TIGR03986 family CRISPR-associated RAMP protein [Geobacillus sp. C56-T2]NNV06834.1 TIGR03986 family CRISPR-associated RAMP protein [Geobacillus sp. MMMUD3]TWG30818.1 CRISPR-associated protein (TIGR03986 family) [Geobacillus sp. C56-T2]